MVTAIWGAIRLVILLNFFINNIVKFFIKTYNFLFIIYSKWIYRSRLLYKRKKRLEERKFVWVKEYNHEESPNKKEKINQLTNHVKNQSENNPWERDLPLLSHRIQYIWLDILRDYNYLSEDSASSQLAKRHWLGKMFWL